MPVALDQGLEVCVDVAMVDVHSLAERDSRNFWEELETALDRSRFGAWRYGLRAVEMHTCGAFIQVEGALSFRDFGRRGGASGRRWDCVVVMQDIRRR